MHFENYVIRQYRNARYKNDFSEKTGIPEEIFKIVYDEYVDASGLYEKEEYERVGLVQSLIGRVNSIEVGIKLQFEYIEEFGQPYFPNFEVFKKYGHILVWKEDVDKFLDQLERIQRREEKFNDQLQNKVKELEEYRAKKVRKEISVKESQKQFTRMLNTLGKENYKIDQDKTTVEELAEMISQQTELVEEHNAAVNKK